MSTLRQLIEGRIFTIQDVWDEYDDKDPILVKADLASLDGLLGPGGCDECEATQQIVFTSVMILHDALTGEPLGPPLQPTLTTCHAPGCPWLERTTR